MVYAGISSETIIDPLTSLHLTGADHLERADQHNDDDEDNEAPFAIIDTEAPTDIEDCEIYQEHDDNESTPSASLNRRTQSASTAELKAMSSNKKKNNNQLLTSSSKPRRSISTNDMLISPRPLSQHKRSPSTPELSTIMEQSPCPPKHINSPHLPLIPCGVLPSEGDCSYGLKMISPQTLAALLTGHRTHGIEHFIIIDCRYSYEYSGGHIEGAININHKQHIQNLFNDYSSTCTSSSSLASRPAIIFHCEYSQQRGPKSCKYFRELDRQSNEYPALHFPDLCLLKGGYKLFYEQYPHLCSPNNYISMWDSKYVSQCKRETLRFRQAWKIPKKRIESMQKNIQMSIEKNLDLIPINRTISTSKSNHKTKSFQTTAKTKLTFCD